MPIRDLRAHPRPHAPRSAQTDWVSSASSPAPLHRMLQQGRRKGCERYVDSKGADLYGRSKIAGIRCIGAYRDCEAKESPSIESASKGLSGHKQ